MQIYIWECKAIVIIYYWQLSPFAVKSPLAPFDVKVTSTESLKHVSFNSFYNFELYVLKTFLRNESYTIVIQKRG